MNSIQTQWEDYAADCVDPMLSADERMQRKTAFFAGAASLMTVQMDVFENSDQEEAAEIMSNLSKECLAFLAVMRANMAARMN